MIGDWVDHVTTAFPEVRLKSYLEMRGADGGPWRRLCALPALWVGLLYDDAALDAACDLVADWTEEEREAMRARRAAARARHAASAAARCATSRSKMLEIAREGLHRRARRDSCGEDETHFLDTLFSIAGSRLAGLRRCWRTTRRGGAAISSRVVRRVFVLGSMLFNSQIFILAFLPLALALYYLVADRHRARQVVLIAASLVFYAYWSVAALPLLVGLTLANWIFIQLYGRGGGRFWPWLGLALNFAVLGVFKYANFFASQVAALFGQTHTPWDIILPLGISFFVFQKISYLVDLARGDRRIYGFLDFFTFVTFFPQLIAGPIVRHNEIVEQFAASPRRPEMWENLSRGACCSSSGWSRRQASPTRWRRCATRCSIRPRRGR